MDGLLVLDKPESWTSFDVVAKLRRITKTRSIGHTGTLDPMATGVLVVCLGKATRLVEYLIVHRKTYDATIRFGSSTTTDDRTGEIVARADPSQITRELIRKALPRFTGAILQTPPAVSALKIDGQRSYVLARAGQDPKHPPRPVEIDGISIECWNPPDLKITVECGPGTYIRSLARDLGEALGSAAHLLELRRTRVGHFGLKDASLMEEFVGERGHDMAEERLLPLQCALAGWPTVSITEEDRERVVHGMKLTFASMDSSPSDLAAGIDGRGALVAILQRQDGYWQPRKVFG